ncbi:MAG: DUF3089 domain-containing protein [Sphingobacteriales bacterium JAD_PAG50586_3]|nr:MAG: DUF3089 domain-containing protein [Sphingobacteriales bacterium JAD_PAG50586_3]
MRKIVLFYLLILLTGFLPACRSRMYTVKDRYNTVPTPTAPDYSNKENWFALPGRDDMADKVMGQKDIAYTKEDSLNADVFFIYPTIFTGKANDDYLWNANTGNETLNNRITNTTIKYSGNGF